MVRTTNLDDQDHVSKVLVDNSVNSLGIIADLVEVNLPDMSNPLVLVQAKSAQTPDAEWLQNQIECIPTIARLAEEGTLHLHTYEELVIEGFKRPRSYPALPFGNLLAKINKTQLPSAIRRGLFFQGDLTNQTSSDALINFSEWLLEIDTDHLTGTANIAKELSEFEIRNLENIDQFRRICRPFLARAHYGDGFHLWTARTNEMEFFLTVDKKFFRAVTNDGQRELTCRPIFPSDLLNELGVEDRDPLPFRYGHRYFLSGLPYD